MQKKSKGSFEDDIIGIFKQKPIKSQMIKRKLLLKWENLPVL